MANKKKILAYIKTKHDLIIGELTLEKIRRVILKISRTKIKISPGRLKSNPKTRVNYQGLESILLRTHGTGNYKPQLKNRVISLGSSSCFSLELRGVL